MALICGFIGALIIFFMLRRKGGVGRHLIAFVLGFIVSGFLLVFALTATLSRAPSAERVFIASVVGVLVILVLQGIAMLAAMFVRRNAAKALPPPAGAA